MIWFSDVKVQGIICVKELELGEDLAKGLISVHPTKKQSFLFLPAALCKLSVLVPKLFWFHKYNSLTCDFI